MNCEETANLMDGYLDGELDALTSQTIEQHLRECHKCDEAFEVGMALDSCDYHALLLQGHR